MLASPPPTVNVSRLLWDLETSAHAQYHEYWQRRELKVIPPEIFTQDKQVWLEIGAGSGRFCTDMARMHPEAYVVAIERARDRGNRLVRKTKRSGLPNVVGLRGNAIPALIYGVPAESVERIYILYPCPFPKSSQRKNRWYLHPVMPHLIRILKPGGLMVWASDQQFFIEEAGIVCEKKYGLETLSAGPLAPNQYNELAQFPLGRSKFEQMFLEQGLSNHEYIGRKPHNATPREQNPERC